MRRFQLRATSILVPLVLLASGGCSAFESVEHFTSRISDKLSGHTPVNAAKKMEDPYFPDERRNGINALANDDFGRRSPYTDRYEQIASSDPDWLVRATAIRALNRSRCQHATPIFIRALKDERAIVRVESAKALGNVPDDRAVPMLVHLLSDTTEDRDVRIACADALRGYRSMEVGRTLAGQLNGREFGVAWQSRQSLQKLTGKDLQYSESDWLNYLGGASKPLG